jgi:chemotaxis protein CheC
VQLLPERPAHAPRRRSRTADRYTDAELDALREVANIGSSTAATAMSSLIGVPVDVSTPSARAMQLTDAIERAGPAEMIVTTVVVPVTGDLEALVLMVLAQHTEEAACRLIGVERDSDLARSALVELGNILAASYLGALSTLTGLSLEPSPPEGVRDMLRAVLSSALLRGDGDGDVLILESTLSVAVVECSPTFLFVPHGGSVEEIIERLRVAT